MADNTTRFTGVTEAASSAAPTSTTNINVSAAGVDAGTRATAQDGAGERGRGRGQTRGRWRGRGRGRGKSTENARKRSFCYEDPSKGWTKQQWEGAIAVEKDLTDEVISTRARSYCSAIIKRLSVELKANILPDNEVGLTMLLVGDLLTLLCKYLNQYIALNEPGRKIMEMSDMIRWVAVLLMSSLADISFDKALEEFSLRDCKVPPRDRMSFINSNVMAFQATKRGKESDDEWAAQRDATQRLDNFERTAYEMSRNVCLSPNNTTVTLDDDLYGTRARDNQVKTLSARKADKEGHSADVICDAIFRITLGVRFRRRGETQATNVDRLLDVFVAGHGEISLRGIIASADRGYGSITLLKSFLSRGMGGIMIMPSHLLKCHPFVGDSHFSVTRHDDEAGDYYNISIPDDQANSDEEEPNCEADDSRQDLVRYSGYDRRPTFVVPVDPDAGIAVYAATRKFSIPVHGHGADRNKETVTALAVRERGNDKSMQLIRFLFSVPVAINEALKTWVAVPRSNEQDQSLLFTGGSDRMIEKRSSIEGYLRQKVLVLTKGQRCADWFILRQFRITGTVSGKILLSDSLIISHLGHQTQEVRTLTRKDCLNDLLKSWFSSSRSTEYMKRGSLNEDPVLNALSSRTFIIDCFECGMLALKDEQWIACSPDAIALLNPADLSSAFGLIDGDELIIASVEIKTSIASSSLDVTHRHASLDVIYCRIGDHEFVRRIPLKHCGQLLQQSLVLDVDYFVYVAASETSILFICVIYIPSYVRRQSLSVLVDYAKCLVSWVHEENGTPPPELDPAGKRLVGQKLPFWRLVNKHVVTNGPLPPLKLFRHGSQTFYSRTKGGVDGSAQYRSTLRSSMTVFRWEQKLITQTIKSVIANAYIVWKINRGEKFLETPSSFAGVDRFRNNINKGCSFGNFVIDLCPNLVRYAERLDSTPVENGEPSEHTMPEISSDTAEVRRLRQAVSNIKRNRVEFFNSPDGVRVRLQLHPHLQRFTHHKKHCALCGTGVKRSRSKFKCSTCDVHLCVRVHPEKRTSCWAKWHETKRLITVPSHWSTGSKDKDKRMKLASSSMSQEAPQLQVPTSVQQPTTSTPSVRSELTDTVSTRKRPAPLSDSSTHSDGVEEQDVQLAEDRVLGSGAQNHSQSEAGHKTQCASACGRLPLLDCENAAHVCEGCRRPVHAFCVYAPGGRLGGEEYEGFGAGGYCKSCSLSMREK